MSISRDDLETSVWSDLQDDSPVIDILDGLLDRIHRGEPVDVDELLRQHPELADQLSGYIESLRFLNGAAADVAEFRGNSDPGILAEKRIGDYELVREVGRGGMGIVYEAQQTSLDRKVAIKVLPFASVLDSKQIARFRIEAHAAAQLNHPHIVPVFAVGHDAGVHYYSMQYIDGAPLQQVIDELRRLQTPSRSGTGGDKHTEKIPAKPLEFAFAASSSTSQREYMAAVARLGIQAADALHHAHELGVVHRDVKPSNLMIDRSGKLWITDFGLARCQSDSNVTISGAVLGSVHYMSPEQARGRTRLVDHRADVYSLGITLYELLTLQKAFPISDRLECLQAIANDEPPAPRRLNRSVPVDLETIVLKAISKRRGQRYASADEMARDLRRFLDGKPVAARRPSLVDRAAKWSHRHRSIVVGLSAVLAALLLMGTISAFLIARQQAQTRHALATAETNLALSRDHFRQARAVVDHLGLRSAEKLATIPGAEPLRHELLTSTLEYYRQFMSQADDPALQADLAIAHFKTAELLEQLGSWMEALESYQQAEAILSTLVQENDAPTKQKADLATCYNNIGLLRSRTGRLDLAMEAYHRAYELQQDLTTRLPGDKGVNRSLALLCGNIGLLLGQQGHRERAEKYYLQAMVIQRKLAKESPDDAATQHDLAMTLNNISFLYNANSLAKSLEFNDKGLRILRSIATPSSDPRFAADLALSLNNRAMLLSADGQRDAARNCYDESIAISKQLVARAPHVPQHRKNLGVSYNNLGRFLNQQGKHQAAADSLEAARQTLTALVNEFPADGTLHASLGGVLQNLAATQESLRQHLPAVDNYRQAIHHFDLASQSVELGELRDVFQQSYDKLEQLLAKMNRPQEADQVRAEGQRVVESLVTERAGEQLLEAQPTSLLE